MVKGTLWFITKMKIRRITTLKITVLIITLLKFILIKNLIHLVNLLF